ncbi:MAG: SusC/RagA family TonB-linked outer membrane protein [Flavobacterium sp.]
MRSKFKWILTLVVAFLMQFSFAQEKTISGTVTDESMPLPGASVVVKGTNRGTTTDFDGNYSIKAKAGEVLEFSFVGYKTRTATVGASNTLNIKLESDTKLEEVVVVGYSTQSKAKVTAAVSRVEAKQIEQVPIASLDQALQGNIAGANIKVGSGQPGQQGQIIIRGRNSLAGNIEPLFLVDGMPVNEDNFRTINSNDIESIDVLKDASASALYGSRGAGGVVVVTTKKGKFGGGTQFAYRQLYGFSSITQPGFQVMNTQQFLTFQRDRARQGFGFNGVSGGVNLGRALTDAEIAAYAEQANTDWSKIFFRTGKTESHEITMNSGNEKVRSFTSMSFFNQEGITLRSSLRRATFRNNLEVKANDRMSYGTQVFAGYSSSDFVVDRLRDRNTGGQLDNPFIVPYLGLPYMSAFNPNGSLNTFGTLLSDALLANGQPNINGINGFLNTPYLALNTNTMNTDKERELRLLGNFNVSYKLMDNLVARSVVGMDYTNEERLFINHPMSHRGQINPDIQALQKGSQYEGFFRDYRFNTTNSLTYNFTLNEKHDFEIGGYTEYFYQESKFGSFQAYGLNPLLVGSGSAFTDGNVREGGTNFYVPDVSSSSSDVSLFSYFGLLKYDYGNKYGFQASLRRDNTSRFNRTNKWGTFWSVAGRWNIKEEFFKESKINELKMRVSYGQAGNQDVGSRYLAFEQLAINAGYQGAQGYNVTGLIDPNLSWETTTQFNVGLDFAFINNRLRGSVDVYNKISKDVLINAPVETETGFGGLFNNAAGLSNKGVELTLSYDVVKNDNWIINLFVNGAYNKNNIDRLADSDFIQTGLTALQVGRPFGSFWVTRWAGVNPANGLPLYYDAQGELTEVLSDANRVFIDKQEDPFYTGGFGANIKFKNFELNTLFAFAADQYRVDSSIGLIQDGSFAGISNQDIRQLTAWQNVGDVTAFPIPTISTRLNATDRYVRDASFLRLRNIVFAYNFDKELMKKTKFFTGARIYFQGQNLLTWTKWQGFDPESTSNSSFFDYPTPRQYTFGLDLNF